MNNNMNFINAVETARFHHQELSDRICYKTGYMDSTELDNFIEKGHKIRKGSIIGGNNSIIIIRVGKKQAGRTGEGIIMLSVTDNFCG